MRSVFFQNPLEYQIQTDREEWNQGDSIQGRLRVRNMSGNSVPSIQSSLVLAYGVRKEIKSGDAEAWKIQSEIMPISGANLDPQGEINTEWELKLSDDCPITDKSASLFLLFGGDKVMEEGGRIDLRVELHPILQSFLKPLRPSSSFWKSTEKAKKTIPKSNSFHLNRRNSQTWNKSFAC